MVNVLVPGVALMPFCEQGTSMGMLPDRVNEQESSKLTDTPVVFDDTCVGGVVDVSCNETVIPPFILGPLG